MYTFDVGLKQGCMFDVGLKQGHMYMIDVYLKQGYMHVIDVDLKQGCTIDVSFGNQGELLNRPEICNCHVKVCQCCVICIY